MGCKGFRARKETELRVGAKTPKQNSSSYECLDSAVELFPQCTKGVYFFSKFILSDTYS